MAMSVYEKRYAPGMIRLLMGLESPDDLTCDLDEVS
jgi:cystathionine beta-lyase/cystathionine gamma-synthase